MLAGVMDMKQFVIPDLEKLHLVFRAYRSHDGFGCWYRGQGNVGWALIPKAGRGEHRLPDNRDLGRFNAWCDQAVAYCNLPSSYLDRLALAQHHGLATRLLDWTKNPLVACYFACCEHPTVDGAVYMYEMPSRIITEEFDFSLLAQQEGIFGYLPKAIAPRILNQKGLFTVHCDAMHPIDVEPSRIDNSEPNLVRMVIPSKLKEEVLKLLYDYGIDQSFLFPGLDGLSAQINNQTAKMGPNA